MKIVLINPKIKFTFALIRSNFPIWYGEATIFTIVINLEMAIKGSDDDGNRWHNIIYWGCVAIDLYNQLIGKHESL